MQIAEFFDKIDASRILRAREALRAQTLLQGLPSGDPYAIGSKSIILLCYASWEGFYNDCVDTYFSFLKNSPRSVRDHCWNLLFSVLQSDFESLRSRNHSVQARLSFVRNLSDRLEARFGECDESVVKARSNLNFGRLRENFEILDFDVAPFEFHRLRIDKELVGWRNAVAHGSAPNLAYFDLKDHVDFTSKMLILLADQFQKGASV